MCTANNDLTAKNKELQRREKRWGETGECWRDGSEKMEAKEKKKEKRYSKAVEERENRI